MFSFKLVFPCLLIGLVFSCGKKQEKLKEREIASYELKNDSVLIIPLSIKLYEEENLIKQWPIELEILMPKKLKGQFLVTKINMSELGVESDMYSSLSFSCVNSFMTNVKDGVSNKRANFSLTDFFVSVSDKEILNYETKTTKDNGFVRSISKKGKIQNSYSFQEDCSLNLKLNEKDKNKLKFFSFKSTKYLKEKKYKIVFEGYN